MPVVTAPPMPPTAEPSTRRSRRRRGRGRAARRRSRTCRTSSIRSPRRSTRCGARASAACSSTARRVTLDDVDPATLQGSRRRSQVIVDRVKVEGDLAHAAHRLDRDRVPRRRRRGVRHRAAAQARARRAGRAPVHRAVRVPRPAASPTRCRSRGCSRSTTRSAPARPATASATSSSSTWTWSCPIRRSRSTQGAIEPWSKPHYRAQLAELKRAAQDGRRPARRAVGAT